MVTLESVRIDLNENRWLVKDREFPSSANFLREQLGSTTDGVDDNGENGGFSLRSDKRFLIHFNSNYYISNKEFEEKSSTLQLYQVKNG